MPIYQPLICLWRPLNDVETGWVDLKIVLFFLEIVVYSLWFLRGGDGIRAQEVSWLTPWCLSILDSYVPRVSFCHCLFPKRASTLWLDFNASKDICLFVREFLLKVLFKYWSCGVALTAFKCHLRVIGVNAALTARGVQQRVLFYGEKCPVLFKSQSFWQETGEDQSKGTITYARPY